MGDIYALQGRDKCGKTPTLKLLAGILKTKYPQAQVQDFPSNDGDIKIIIEIDIEVKVKVRVGIASQGDVGKYFILDKTLADFANAKCGIIFCACRTRGETEKCIKALTGYTPHFIKQTILSSGSTVQQVTQSNTLVAQKMVRAAGL